MVNDQNAEGHVPDDMGRPQQVDEPAGSTEGEAVRADEQPVCVVCGGAIGIDDLVCPHCGESLAAG